MNIKDLKFTLMHPLQALRAERASPELDAWIERRLDNGQQPVVLDEYHAEFDGFKIWIANAPYADVTWKAPSGGKLYASARVANRFRQFMTPQLKKMSKAAAREFAAKELGQ